MTAPLQRSGVEQPHRPLELEAEAARAAGVAKRGAAGLALERNQLVVDLDHVAGEAAAEALGALDARADLVGHRRLRLQIAG